VSKVGGLVGKVLEIDEKTRLRPEYVPMRIPCRDVTKVPRKAEGTLGLYIHEFIFEREVQESDSGKMLSSGIRVGTSDSQPPQKKYKYEVSTKDKQSGTVSSEQNKNHQTGFKGDNQKSVCASAPPKYMDCNP